MYVTAVVLAAGKGLRLKAKMPKYRYPGENLKKKSTFGISKPLIAVNSKPLVIYCLNILSNHPYIKDIIVVASLKNLKDMRHKIRQYRIGKIKDIVLGGGLRQDSVMEGLKAMDSRTELVLIHDAVRPFIDKTMISSVIKAAKICGAAIVAVPVKATIKTVVSRKSSGVSKFIVKETLNRNNLWEIQTPQVFKKGLILKAYKKFGNTHVTDDASLVEKLGRRVRVVEGSYFNVKITTPEDLVLAEAISKSRKL